MYCLCNVAHEFQGIMLCLYSYFLSFSEVTDVILVENLVNSCGERANASIQHSHHRLALAIGNSPPVRTETCNSVEYRSCGRLESMQSPWTLMTIMIVITIPINRSLK